MDAENALHHNNFFSLDICYLNNTLRITVIHVNNTIACLLGV